MPSLQYTVYGDAANVALGEVISEGVLAISDTAAQSPALPGERRTYTVRLFPESACFVTWGADPTALINGTDGRMMGPDNPEYFSIEAGDKISVIERV